MGENAGKYGKCVECADAAQKTLSEAGVGGKRVRIEADAIGVPGPAGATVRAGETGFHEVVESGGMVYDNFNPAGLPVGKYYPNTFVSGIVSITSTEF